MNVRIVFFSKLQELSKDSVLLYFLQSSFYSYCIGKWWRSIHELRCNLTPKLQIQFSMRHIIRNRNFHSWFSFQRKYAKLMCLWGSSGLYLRNFNCVIKLKKSINLVAVEGTIAMSIMSLSFVGPIQRKQVAGRPISPFFEVGPIYSKICL